jgi:hypothetical protein
MQKYNRSKFWSEIIDINYFHCNNVVYSESKTACECIHFQQKNVKS